LILTSIISAIVMSQILYISILGYLVTTIMGIILLSLTIMTIMKFSKLKNGKTFSRSLVHITMILMIFSYFAVDPNSHYASEVLIPGKVSIVEEFDLSIYGWREGGDEYPTIVLDVTESGKYLGQVVLRQGVYSGDVWNQADWLTKNAMDYYFKMENMEYIDYKRDSPIVLEIHHKPLTNLFRITFYMYIVVTLTAVIVRIRSRPKTTKVVDRLVYLPIQIV
ncbi:hypothetical protein LCGC14_2981800, partial [marine sediment metagenome]